MSDEKLRQPRKKGSVNKIETDVNEHKKENMFLRGALLDIQTRSIRENLVLKGIKEKEGEYPESLVKKVFLTVLQIPSDAVDKIQLDKERGQIICSQLSICSISEMDETALEEMIIN